VSTSISLPSELEDELEREAAARGMSLSEFVRASLQWVIAHKISNDPLFADQAVYRDDGPDDLAANHDDYLYEDAT
jgi:hypothetical protein